MSTLAKGQSVDALGNGGEFGFLVRGSNSRAEALHLILSSGEADGESLESLMRMECEPGWYRKNPCNNGEFAWLLGEGKAGQPGSFYALVLSRSP